MFSKKTFGMYLNGGMYLLLWKVSWCTQPLWCPCGTLAHWFGTLTHWYCCARNPCGTLVLWYNRAILHWHSLALVYWYTAPVVHCAQCAMVHLYTLAHSFGTLTHWYSCARNPCGARVTGNPTMHHLTPSSSSSPALSSSSSSSSSWSPSISL